MPFISVQHPVLVRENVPKCKDSLRMSQLLLLALRTGNRQTLHEIQVGLCPTILGCDRCVDRAPAPTPTVPTQKVGTRIGSGFSYGMQPLP